MTSRPKPSSSRRSNRPFSLAPPSVEESHEPKSEATVPPHHDHRLPFHGGAGRATKWIKPDGESSRSGIHPIKFLAICGRSSNKVSAAVNILWPAVPAAIALYWARPEWHVAIFTVNYIAMVPAANLIGFAGQELARKLPKVFGVVLETTLGSVVEIILFIILIATLENSVPIIKAAILGSILANLLLCLGLCFFVGGILRDEQQFHEAVSEVGSGLMLVAGMGLIIPSAFSAALSNSSSVAKASIDPDLNQDILRISRATALMLLVSFFVYVFFQMRSHHGIYDEIFEHDEMHDADRDRDLAKAKLTLTECILAMAIALTCVALIAYSLVRQIEPIVERGVSDAFMGLILVPLVEKAAEHLTAMDEAWDNQMNFALSHVLGASIQTALLNTPIVVIVGWGLGKQMDLNFEVFDAIVLILAILVVGNFLRDGKSNYLEGFLCFIVYVMIAVAAFYYPSPPKNEGTASDGGESTSTKGGGESSSPSAEAAKMAVRMLARSAGVDL